MAFLAVQPDVDNFTGAVGAYRIDPNDGSLTAVAGTHTTRLPMMAMVADPSGGFLYGVAPPPLDIDVAGGIFAFVIDATSGALSPVAGSGFSARINSSGTARALASSDQYEAVPIAAASIISSPSLSTSGRRY